MVFGKVIDGMDVVDRIYSGAGEKPNQVQIVRQGTAYLKQAFPELSYIRTAKIIGGAAEANTAMVPIRPMDNADKEEV